MKLLVIRFSSLGDCVLLCPLLAHLKGSGAEEVTVVTKSSYAELFACAEGVDRVIALGESGGAAGLVGLARRLRGAGHVVIDAHNSLRSRLLCRGIGGARARIAKHYRSRIGWIVFKRAATIPTILEQYAELSRAAGTPVPVLSPGGITVPGPVKSRVEARWSAAGGPAIALAPGSRWPSKRWGRARYHELAERLVADHGCRVVLVGDEADGEITRPIARALGDRAIDAAGKASIMETAGWIERCDGFVGNDSGLMHLAEALGVPAVGLFGPTVRGFGYAPALSGSKTIERDVPCRPCSRNGARPCPKGTRECLAAIGVDAVENAVLDVLNRRGERHTIVQ